METERESTGATGPSDTKAPPMAEASGYTQAQIQEMYQKLAEACFNEVQAVFMSAAKDKGIELPDTKMQEAAQNFKRHISEQAEAEFKKAKVSG